MSDDVQASAPAPEPSGAEPAPRPRRRWWRRLGTGVRRVLMFTAILLAVALVTTITVDLGPAVRGLAERAGSSYLKRDLTIGRLSIRLLTGAFVVENLRIGGLQPGDRPFLTARTIDVSMSFGALVHREVLIDSVVMTDWQVLVETWPNGRHSFPRFTRDGPKEPGPKRFVTTVKRVLARQGQFTFEDHGVPWSTVARNLEVEVTGRKVGPVPSAPQGKQAPTEYGGTAKFSDGTVAIQQYVPMKTDMSGTFRIEGPLVRFTRLELVSDGSRSDITGAVDTSRWPEQTWNVQSVVQFPRMREIFFARERWRLGGEGHFTGVFHLFKGGRDLSGTFTSPLARVNDLVVSGSPRIASMVAGKLQRDESVGGVRRRSHALRVRACTARAARPAATRHVQYRVREGGPEPAWRPLQPAGHWHGWVPLGWHPTRMAAWTLRRPQGKW